MPGENLQDWSPIAANNANADSLINWAEGQPRASVNDSARSMMAAHAKNRNLQNGSIVTTGTANAQAFSTGMVYASVPNGMRVLLKIGPGLTNTGAATLSMDGSPATAVQDRNGLALGGGELAAGGVVEFLYNGTNWIAPGVVTRTLTGVAIKTAAYSVVAGDNNTRFLVSGTWTLSHTITAAAGAGFVYWIKNTGTGTITIDPAGSETIDGFATRTCYAGQAFQMCCDGTNWYTIGRAGSVILSENIAPGGGTNITIPLPPDYSHFQFDMFNVGTSATAQLQFQLSIDGGATWLGTPNYYNQFSFTSGATFIGVAQNAVAAGLWGGTNFANGKMNGRMILFPGPGISYFQASGQAWQAADGTQQIFATGGMQNVNVARVNAITFFPNTGTLLAGSGITLAGICAP